MAPERALLDRLDANTPIKAATAVRLDKEIGLPGLTI
jgi:hypothetical protein